MRRRRDIFGFLAYAAPGGRPHGLVTDSCGSALDSGYSVLFRLWASYCVWRPTYEGIGSRGAAPERDFRLIVDLEFRNLRATDITDTSARLVCASLGNLLPTRFRCTKPLRFGRYTMHTCR